MLKKLFEQHRNYDQHYTAGALVGQIGTRFFGLLQQKDIQQDQEPIFYQEPRTKFGLKPQHSWGGF